MSISWLGTGVPMMPRTTCRLSAKPNSNAAMILGRWSPKGALLAALLFGFADNLQVVLGIIGTPVPSQLMLMTPYLATIFAVAGLVGRNRPPASEGIPYVK